MAYISSDIIERLNSLNIEEVARQLGLNVVKHKALCFMHNDHSPSLSFNIRKNYWKCFVCNRGGGSINLVMEYYKINFVEACEWLCKQYGINIGYYKPNYRMTTVRRYIPNQETTSYSARFNSTIGQWLINNTKLSELGRRFLYDERKLSETVVTHLNIRSIENSNHLKNQLLDNFDIKELEESGFIKETDTGCYLRFFTPCLIFPYYDYEGNLIGIQTRYIGRLANAPRFQFVASFKPIMFNERITERLTVGDTLIISEGVTDCMALLSAGYNTIAIPSATNIPLHILKKLTPYKLYMAVDRDEAGERAFRELHYNIVKLGVTLKRFDFPLEYKDYAEYYRAK